jgi:Peptidase family M28/PA domain
MRKTLRLQRPLLGLQLLVVLFVLLLSLPMVTGTLLASDKDAKYPAEVLEVKQSIKGRMLVSHIHFLASKYCRGREPGDIGMKIADKYIYSVLSGIGITPAGTYGGYFEKVDLKNVSLDKNISLKLEESISGSKKVRSARLNWDYLPVILSAETSANAPLVFAGYGITAPEHKYDDYKGINVTGKIVLVLRHEPGEKDAKSPFDGVKNSPHGTLLKKILNAQKHGAVGIIFMTDPLNHKDLTVMGGSYRGGTYWPTLSKDRWKKDEDFKFLKFRPRTRIIDDNFGITIPVATIGGKFAAAMLGQKINVKQIQQQMDKQMKPNSFAIPGKRISMDIFFKNEVLQAHNIVARIDGSDPQLKNEVVIIGAHYDHVGKDNRGQVYGGADDNASGTAAVIELMRAFKALKKAPKRTILFMLFTAEEKGLLGARFYAENPLYPIDKTVAFFNLDMIGRNDVSQISVLGKYQYPRLFKIVQTANKKSVNFTMNFNAETLLARSDQMPFLRKGIPSIYLNSGFHEQYHRPQDTVGRIVPEKIERVTQLMFLSLWETANVPAGTDFRVKEKK